MERIGMRREAHLAENEFVKGEWTDELIYAILRREWERAGPPVRLSASGQPGPLAGGPVPG
jgi:hypothetical protein